MSPYCFYLNILISLTSLGGALASAKTKVANWWFKGSESGSNADKENLKKEYIRPKDLAVSPTEGDEHERQELLPDKPQQIDSPGPFVVDDDDEDIDIDVLLSRGSAAANTEKDDQ